MKKVLFAGVSLLLALTGTQAAPSTSFTTTVFSSHTHNKIKSHHKIGRVQNTSSREDEVSYQAQQEMYRIYGNVPDIQWTKTKRFDEAHFVLNGVPTTAYFNFDAELVGSTSIKQFGDLPASARKRIEKEYKDYEVGKVVFFDDNEDNQSDLMLYDNQTADADNYFVELKKEGKTIILQVSDDANVSYFEKE